MWTNKDNTKFTPRGFPFYTPHRSSSSNMYSPPPSATTRRRLPESEKKWKPPQSNINRINNNNNVNFIYKVPAGDSPYVRAKHVQLVDKNPSKAVAMFWAAINLGDRVDSALKDMTAAMKQLDRSDEAIEAIKSFRHMCPLEAQESLDNIMLELYKRAGRIEEQTRLLELRVKHIEDDAMQNLNKTRLARSQGKRIQITMGQEYSRLLGNLAWAYLQQDKYKLAEDIYRKALSLEADKNKQCNLAICLMYTNRMTEAKFLLNTVKDSNRSRETYECYAKSYERAIQVMHELESCKSGSQFSSFLLGMKKETDSSEEGINGNCESTHADTPFAYKKPYNNLSPFKNSDIPNTPFTQPRDESGSDCGCFRKLQFGHFAENQYVEVNLPGKASEKSVIPETGTHRKSWADMTEDEEYGDENVDCCNTMAYRWNL